MVKQKSEQTMIKVSKVNAKKLKECQVYPNESYESIITRAVNGELFKEEVFKEEENKNE